ncbi:MAG: ThuA domain-containing protein [Bryobacteraceae bacterium]|nr:ThuA domain-containing protein [Bryobacterales bacterium]MEB2363199.1 ThuA domain-containing protein [Bryobacterales bacterium]NUN01861.1 ThuA domain-containing protein [Bryobacteraceae bacterium]
MKLLGIIGIWVLLVGSPATLPAQQTKKKVLAIGEVKGFQHDSVSHALATIWKLGQESKLWDTYIRTDSQLITKKKLGSNAKNLDYFDAIVFYTTGELDMDESQKADFLSFIHDDGKGFVGIHSANDTFYKWPEYGKMIGGYFDAHPWNQFQAPIIVEDRDFPATRHFPKEFVIHDEIYQVKDYSRGDVRVLMRLDENKIDLNNKNVHRKDKDFAVTWVKNYGKGRVFYSSFGHREDALDRQDVQKMYLEAVKWALGLTQGDATPRPKPEK